MNIKSIILAVLFIMQVSENSYGQKTGKMVFLTGIVKNFNNQVQVEDMSEMKDLDLPNSDRIFTLDSANHFSISFTLEKPGYFRVGRNILYLSPGDNLSMLIDFFRCDSSAFKGTGSPANEYLKLTPFPKGGSFLEAGEKIRTTIQETINEVLLNADKRSVSLKNCSNISADFRSLEQARIHADVLNSLIMLKFYFPYVHKIKNDSLDLFEKEYTKIVSPYIELYSKKTTINPFYLQLVVYRQMLSTILSQLPANTKNAAIVKDWIKASDLVQQFKKLNEKKDIASFENEIQGIQTPKYKTAVVKTFNKLMEFRNGDDAIDFVMLDMNKGPVPLSNFRGKIIYIDLWATWCGPCMEEMPFLDTLKERYKNNNVVFISLSIDDDPQRWLANLKKRNDSDNQFVIDRAKLEPYSVVEIPRVIIINKEFKIETMNGNLPSSKNTITVLEKLLMH